jgi:hypothetical protein
MTAPDPDHLAALRAFAEHLLAGREQHRARLVADGKLVPPAIGEGLRLARALVALWRWATDAGAGPLPEPDMHGWWGSWHYDLAVEAQRVADRARQRADAAPDDADARRTAELADALADWQRLGRLEARIVRLVDPIRCDRARIAARQLARAA